MKFEEEIEIIGFLRKSIDKNYFTEDIFNKDIEITKKVIGLLQQGKRYRMGWEAIEEYFSKFPNTCGNLKIEGIKQNIIIKEDSKDVS